MDKSIKALRAKYRIKGTRPVGLVFVGEWGSTATGQGAIYAKPEDKPAVQRAYDGIQDGDMGPNVLDDVYDAGGVFLRG